MAKELPYFRWYAADAETDEAYSSLTDQELGFYHRCLNRAWLNDGLPIDLNELAAAMRVGRKYLDKVWDKVGKCWYEEDGRLRNRRQEEERTHAITKSERSTNAVRTRYGRTTNVLPRAYVSESVSESVSEIQRKEFQKPKVQEFPSAKPSEKFAEVWSRWPRKTGQDSAAMDWCSVVTTENEAAALTCVDRYLASMEVAEGKVRNLGSTMSKPGWLIDCARDNWACDWPKARASPKTRQELDDEIVFASIARGQKLDAEIDAKRRQGIRI